MHRPGIAVLIASVGRSAGRPPETVRKTAHGVPVRAGHLVECFASADLDLALGRTNVIHAAINPGGLAQKFLACARRYEVFELNGAAQAES